MIAVGFLRRFRQDKAGVAALEFALISPLIIALFMGVLQVGIALQNYNALRGVSADVSRYAMIQYATGNILTNDQLTSYATSVARDAPYLLGADMVVRFTDVDEPQVTGVTEKTLQIDYQIPSVLATMGLNGPTISYTRSVYLTTAT